MGAVWLAEHSVMGRQVALKVIRPEHLARPGAAERFRREVQAAACLHHPNIVTAHDADQAGATHFLVMEYVEGVSLAEHLERTGPLPVVEACRLARDAALGLQHAHEHGLIHRDVKPHNLMLTADGGVKILDFGLAALAGGGSEEAARLTGANMVVGTPDYIAPEQAEDAHAADIRSDVYSLGCTLYQMLAGRVPFPGGSVLRKLDAHRTRPPEPIRCPAPRRADRTGARAGEDDGEGSGGPLPDAGRGRRGPGAVHAAKGSLRPRRRWPLAVAAAVLFAGLAAAAVAVYRVETDKGQLVITTESDDVEVVIKQNGKEIRVVDTKTDKSITLWSGEYELELKGAGEGLKLNIDKATLTRGDTVLAKIERTPKPAGQAQARQAVEEIRELRTFTGHEKLPRHVIFSPDGKLLISASDDGTIRFWDIETGDEVVRRRLTNPSGRFFDVSVSSDGKQLLSAGDDGVVIHPQLRLWDLSTGKVVREFPVPAVGITTVRFSPDDRQAVSTHYDGSARVWNVGAGKEVQSFTHPGPAGEVYSADWSPDGRWIVSGNMNHLAVWEAETGKVVREWLPPAGFEVVQAAFTPDGKRVVTGNWKRILKVFDIETGHALLSVQLPDSLLAVQAPVWKEGSLWFALAPDNRRVLITAPLSTPELWELGTGKVVGRLVGHQATAYGAAFSPDGKVCGDHERGQDDSVVAPARSARGQGRSLTNGRAAHGNFRQPAGAPRRQADRRRLAAAARPVPAAAADVARPLRRPRRRRRRFDAGSAAGGVPRGRRVCAARRRGVPGVAAHHPRSPGARLLSRPAVAGRRRPATAISCGGSTSWNRRTAP